MTEDQKFVFDQKGWLLIADVLDENEIGAIRRHLYGLRDVPQHHRNSYAGPCAELLDHPVVADILREIVAPDCGENAYGFRCDDSFYTIRSNGWESKSGPHNGGPNMAPTHMYSCRNGRIVSPCVRVVWELNPIGKNEGGTPFLSGSHKSAFDVPEARRDICDELFEDHACPAGSAIVFSENVRHSGTAWTNPRHDRVTIFNHYMHHGMRFHKGTAPQETVAEMPAKRRTLFRGVCVAAFPAGKAVPNDFYSEDNRAL